MAIEQSDKEKFENVIDHLKHELSALRTGRASSGLVENILVESYGSKLPLSHMASISIPDAKSIAIQPWDKANLGPIEKAIQASNIGLNPVNDGALIRLSIPPMTEERRKEMSKVVGQLAEQAKVSIRNIREDLHKDLKKQEDDNTMTADDVVSGKKDLQAVVDGYNEHVKDIAVAKEKEIMTI